MNGTTILAGLLALTTFGSGTGVSLDTYYVNKNSIPLTEIQYEQLETMGFDEYEIDNMSQERFDKLVSYGFIPNEATTTANNYGQQNNTDDPPVASPNAAVPYPGYGSPPTVEFTKSDAYKTMTITVTISQKDEGYYYLYVDQDLIWNNVPEDRYSDILAINYDDDLYITSTDGYLDIDAFLGYTEKNTVKTGSTLFDSVKTTETVTEHKFYYDSYDESKLITHKIDEYLAFQANLPKDEYYSTVLRTETTEYSDFRISLSTIFKTQHQNQGGAMLQGYYGHQEKKLHFEPGKLSFTTSPPYISYSVDLPEYETVFDDVMYRDFSIDFSEI